MFIANFQMGFGLANGVTCCQRKSRSGKRQHIFVLLLINLPNACISFYADTVPTHTIQYWGKFFKPYKYQMRLHTYFRKCNIMYSYIMFMLYNVFVDVNVINIIKVCVPIYTCQWTVSIGTCRSEHQLR